MNFVELVYVSVGELQRCLVRQIEEKRLRIQGSVLEVQCDLGRQLSEKKSDKTVSSSPLQPELVRKAVNRVLRTQVWKTNTVREWTLAELDSYCVFDNKWLATCQSLIDDPSKLTGRHLSRLAPLMKFEFTAVTLFLKNQENLKEAFQDFLRHARGWEENDLRVRLSEVEPAVEAYVVSQCLNKLNQ